MKEGDNPCSCGPALATLVANQVNMQQALAQQSRKIDDILNVLNERDGIRMLVNQHDRELTDIRETRRRRQAWSVSGALTLLGLVGHAIWQHVNRK